MKHKYSFLVLFIVVVVFSILGSLTYEPFSNLLDISRGDISGGVLTVPSCDISGSKSSSGTGSFGSGNLNFYSEDSILKTQIVPPVCPACPPYIGHSHSNLAELDASTNLTQIPIAERQTQQEKARADAQFSFKQTSETKTTPPPRESSNLLGGLFGSGGGGSGGGSGSGGSGSRGMGTNALGGFNRGESGTDISEYKAEIEKLKEQLRELKAYDGNPPPCPACERCPEPSFDCKKVPNYRSTALGEYLPMPVLNDFSSFN